MIWTPAQLAAYYAEMQRLKKELAKIPRTRDTE